MRTEITEAVLDLDYNNLSVLTIPKYRYAYDLIKKEFEDFEKDLNKYLELLQKDGIGSKQLVITKIKERLQ